MSGKPKNQSELDRLNDFLNYTNQKPIVEPEIEAAVTNIENMMLWMQSLDIHSVSSEDYCSFKVGIPYHGTQDLLNEEGVFDADSLDVDTVNTRLGIDCFKISIKDKINIGGTIVEKYTCRGYKSSQIHYPIYEYYKDGYTNDTGYEYLDSYQLKNGRNFPLKVQYGGVEQGLPVYTQGTRDMDGDYFTPGSQGNPGNVVGFLPPYIIPALTYLIQNSSFIDVELNDNIRDIDYEQELIGDTMYFRTYDLYIKLTRVLSRMNHYIQSKVEERLGKSDHFLSIENILEETGLMESMKKLKMGGAVDNMHVILKIPASRANEDVLRNMVSSKYTFEEIFPIFENTSMSIADGEGHIKEQHYTEVYEIGSNEYDLDKTGIKVRESGYDENGDYQNALYSETTEHGCYYLRAGLDQFGNENGSFFPTHREFRINKDWLENVANINDISILVGMGLDIEVDLANRCSLDTILIIVIVIVITYVTAGQAFKESAAAGYAAIAAGALTVMDTLGAFGQGTTLQKNVKILIALLNLYSIGQSVYSKGLENITTNEVIQFAAQVGSSVVEILQIDSAFNHNRSMNQIEEDTKKYEDSARLYESNLRYSYGDLYRKPYDMLHVDPHKAIRDQYADFSTFPNAGFK
jgi:hypothetical protein